MGRAVLAQVLLVPCVLATPAAARTLTVGPGQAYEAPSAASRVAQDGDTVLIQPGEYFDCAVWDRNNLVIAGAAPGVVITDRTCQGKALFVVVGNSTTIRDLTLARARVLDGNGAGIRLEGQGLTLDRVQFVNNQVGLLSGGTGAPVRITGCSFEAGGSGGDRPTYAVLVGEAPLLRIEASTFAGVKGGQISTGAARTELVGNRIGSGTGDAPGWAVLATGGALSMQDNVVQLGPKPPRLNGAVLATDTGPVELRGNRLINETGEAATLLLDWTGSDWVAESNQVGRGDTVRSTSGLLRHRVLAIYQGTKDTLRGFAGQAKRGLRWALGR